MYKLNPALKDFWRSRKPYKFLKGGRFSSKTQDAAGMAIYLARNYSVKFLCIRQFQNRISDSVYTVLIQKIDEAGWNDEFNIGVSSIEHKTTGSTFLFYGIARNINDIKGTEGVDVCWIEEAEGLTSEQWTVIDPTIRKEGSQIWVLWNPRFAADFVQSKMPTLLGDDVCITRHINYDENPYLSDTAREKAERLKRLDYEEYQHIYLGIPKQDTDGTIIKLSWIESAIDAHLLWDNAGQHKIGFDVADDGKDSCANVYAYGSVAIWADEWKAGEDELLKSCSRTYSNARKFNADIVYDSIGVGASAGAKFDELNESNSVKIKYSKFNAGATVFNPDGYYAQDKQERIRNKDFFSNLKAQSWWLVADRFRNTYDHIVNGTNYPIDEMISISSGIYNLDKLKTELSTPKRDFDQNGRVKVESKKDLAKRDVPSPNMADAFIMAFAPVKKPMTINDSVVNAFMRK